MQFSSNSNMDKKIILKKRYIFLFIGFMLIFSAIAQENASNDSNITDNATLNESIPERTTQTTLSGETNISEEITTINESVLDNTTTKKEQIVDFKITNFIPNEFKIGDTQLNIQVKNIGNTELKNLIAVVSGKGFSTYDVVGIDYLKPDTSSYILVTGNFREMGGITLTIRINEKVFYQNITVIDPNYVDDQQRLKALQEAEEARKKNIAEQQSQLEDLEKKYIALENEIGTKKEQNYDVSGINLLDLKNFLRNAESNIVVGDADKAKANLKIASDEYTYQKNKLDSSKQITKSFFYKVKDNLVLISSTAASIITLFALFEILKRKKESLSKKVMEVKVTIDKKKGKKKKVKPSKKKSKKYKRKKSK